MVPKSTRVQPPQWTLLLRYEQAEKILRTDGDIAKAYKALVDPSSYSPVTIYRQLGNVKVFTFFEKRKQ